MVWKYYCGSKTRIMLSYSLHNGNSYTNKAAPLYWNAHQWSFWYMDDILQRLKIPVVKIRQWQDSWWCHQMETFSALLAICAGNSPVPGEFPTQRLVTRSFDVYFDLHPNKRLSKQSWGWWFETLSCPLWHHRNVIIILGNHTPGKVFIF